MALKRDNLPLSVYVPGDSFLHRMRPSLKIAFLLLFLIVTTIAVRTVPVALGVTAFALALYPLARIPAKVAWGQIWPPLILLIPLAGFQWWAKDFTFAAVMALTLLSAMLLAFLLTLTSTVDAILESLEQALSPLARFGLPVETISLTMALTLRLIPLMFDTVYQVLDARKARGAGLSMMAVATPVIIRALRRARAMGEALQARGVGD